MEMIPSEVIASHCHLLKTFKLLKESIGGIPENLLFQSNPLIRKLHWSGDGQPVRLLEPEDFVVLKNLETLLLNNWTCSDGRLAKALKVVSGALKRLTIGWMYGVLPEDFSPAAALLQEGGKDRHGKDTGPEHIREDFGGVGLRLDRLVWLRWHCGNTSFECLTELVKCCPNLKTFPQTLLHRFSTTGLRILHIVSHMPEEDLREAFKEERWGCRGLHELDLDFGFIQGYSGVTEENKQDLRRMMFEAGYERTSLSYLDYQFLLTHLSKVSALLEFQELEELQRLVLNGIPIRRIRYRSQ
ncbi:hypothetical protein BGX24_002188 [Mortierella sp. AD032]|nr:hypothetical protein BGX24_002188 [Mortierella sp. AD032]